MSQETESFSFDIEDWIARCRSALDKLTTPPYLDAEIPVLQEHLPVDPEAVRRWPAVLQSFARAVETCLAHSPNDLSLRLAALYPLRRGALSNVFQRRTDTEGELKVFRHLAALCVPEKLSNLNELKFELYNMYLAANWDKAEELFLRLALLGLLTPAEMHFLRGQFWFLSVFGRQIMFEMSEDDRICDWVHPSGDHPLRGPEFDQFARPDLLQKGSPAHWVLTAWSTNPKLPEPIPGPELPQIGDDGLLIDPYRLDVSSQVAPWTREELRDYWHGAYRDFTPIGFRNLSHEIKRRLTKAVEDLRQAVKLDEALALCYRPILGRGEFALGNFLEAGAIYERALGDRYRFEDPEGSEKDYQSEILFSAAWAYRQAGRYERAIETMKKGIAAGIAWPGGAWWIAKWYSECGEYGEAAQHLKLESETPLPPPESWLLSSTLALAEVAKDEEDRAKRFVQQLERTSPEVLQLLKGFTQESWPRFDKLEVESQKRWVYARYLVHRKPLTPEFEVSDLRSAVKEFGWVLENELRSKVFGPFRERVLKDPQLREKTRNAYKCKTNDSFLSFIALEHDEITLGQMIKALERSTSPSNEAEDALARWLKKRFGRIHECVSYMGELNRKRTDATHENAVYKREDVLSIASTCRQALDWI